MLREEKIFWLYHAFSLLPLFPFETKGWNPLLLWNHTCQSCQGPPSCLIQWPICSCRLNPPLSSIFIVTFWSFFCSPVYKNMTVSWFSSYLFRCPFLSHFLSSTPIRPATKCWSAPGLSPWLFSLSSVTLDNLIQSLGFKCDLYADDYYVYSWFSTSFMKFQAFISNLLLYISIWDIW